MAKANPALTSASAANIMRSCVSDGIPDVAQKKTVVPIRIFCHVWNAS